MSTQARPTKAVRREEARLAAERLRAEQERKNRRQRNIVMGSVVAVVAILIVLITVILAEEGRSKLEEVALRPAGSTLSGAIPVGPAGIAGSTEGAAEDAVVVSVYSDYLCGYCALFEETNAAALAELREAGDIVVEYHTIAIYPDSPPDVQLAAAAALIADRAPEAFLDFHHAVMAYQETVMSQGVVSNAEIAEIARGAGVGDDVIAVIESGEYVTGEQSYVPWVTAATDQASQDLGRLATPTILINGEVLDPQYDWRTEGKLAEAIAAARG
jgi:protein-disulfide isomerase